MSNQGPSQVNSEMFSNSKGGVTIVKNGILTAKLGAIVVAKQSNKTKGATKHDVAKAMRIMAAALRHMALVGIKAWRANKRRRDELVMMIAKATPKDKRSNRANPNNQSNWRMWEAELAQVNARLRKAA